MAFHLKDHLTDHSGGWADLHVHTTFSDSLFSPKEAVEKAAENHLQALGITDHDTIDGIAPACAEAQHYNIEIVPGIELSSVDEQYDIHILGYFIDLENAEMLHYIRLFQAERYRRAEKIVAKLHNLGMNVSLDLILQKSGIGSVGRPHIAEVLMEEGFVLSYDEAFYKFLGNGKPAYVPKYKISPAEGIRLIHQAGGLSFIAHPGMDLDSSLLVSLVKQGLDGVEILHPKHSQEKVNELYQFSLRYGLLTSGGSDCHGNRNGASMLGSYNVPYRFVEEMKQKLNQVHQDYTKKVQENPV